MMKKTMILPVVLIWGCMFAAMQASASTARNLDELLQQVKRDNVEESRENKAREAEFRKNRNQQKKLLADAAAMLKKEEARAQALRARFDENEKKLSEQEEQLQRKLGNLGELFGVVRQAAGDTVGILEDSLVSAQYPNRIESVLKMSADKKLPSIPELEELWFRIQEEMTESGKVTQFTASVIEPDGSEVQKTVTRVGVFNAVADGKFLRYGGGELDQLIQIPRQPPARFQSMAADLEAANGGYTAMAVDPSRGSILSLLVQTPTLAERIQQGKEVGYIIIFLAVAGLLLAIVRLVMLSTTGAKVRSQLKSADSPRPGNPLGRVLGVYFEAPEVDMETLERKLDEAIRKEIPSLNRGLSIIKILAVIAPLLGLLGTVTGMIEVFQSITLFGTGDPKMMAGGISQALMTTVLGLTAAIPLTFLHALVSSRSRSIVQVLEEQSAGVIARHAEQRHQ
ncbi:MAG: MotA/TolQ/ExbB proton channel family protein [bacterium]